MATKKAKESPKKRIAIALQGGGSHGSFTWGVLDALLEEDNLEIAGLSGTSAGAMNSTALLQGYLKGGAKGAQKELKAFWHGMAEASAKTGMKSNPFDPFNKPFSLRGTPQYEFLGLMSNFFSPYELNPLDINPLRDFVEDFFDFDLIQKSKDMQVFLCATHVRSGKLKIFTGKEVCENALLASACLPTLFKAVEVKGDFYWDGGFIGNPAIYPLIYNTDAKDVVVIQLRQAFRDTIPKTAADISDRHKEITFNSCLVREMRAIHFITSLIDKGSIKDPDIQRLNMHLIRNEDIAGGIDMSSALNTEKDFFDYMFKEGQKTGKAWLKKNFKSIGVQSTAEIEQDFV